MCMKILIEYRKIFVSATTNSIVSFLAMIISFLIERFSSISPKNISNSQTNYIEKIVNTEFWTDTYICLTVDLHIQVVS